MPKTGLSKNNEKVKNQTGKIPGLVLKAVIEVY